MQAYEFSFSGEERKFLVVAQDTDEAHDLLSEYLKDNKDFRDKERSVTYASEREMKQRFMASKSGSWFRSTTSHWKEYKRCKNNNESRVVDSYLM